MKRCLDIVLAVLAVLALLALSPLLLLVAVCIAAQDGLPVLFKQV